MIKPLLILAALALPTSTAAAQTEVVPLFETAG